MMFAAIAVSAVLATNAVQVSVADMTPRQRLEWRMERTREMRRALHVDEAKLEAFRYEVRKRRLNRAAAEFQLVAEPSNAVVAVSVDYRSGNISVEYADGHKLLQRYTPPPTNEVRRVVRPAKPRRKKPVKGVWKYRAPDGVNEITRYPDGTESTTTVFVVQPPGPLPPDARFIPNAEAE